VNLTKAIDALPSLLRVPNTRLTVEPRESGYLARITVTGADGRRHLVEGAELADVVTRAWAIVRGA
jgi:hypothetical protein